MPHHKATKPAVPVEVLTVTVQRSVRYVGTDNPAQALAAVSYDASQHPESYDEVDDVISYHQTVRLPEDHPTILEVEADAPIHNLEDLCGSIRPADIIDVYNETGGFHVR